MRLIILLIMIWWLKTQWLLNLNLLITEWSPIILRDLTNTRRLPSYTKETNKSKARRIRDNLRRNRINFGLFNKSILEECKYSQIEIKRESKEKLLKTPSKLMFSKCKNICKNGKTHMEKRDFEIRLSLILFIKR
jgi:hypothetical protein